MPEAAPQTAAQSDAPLPQAGNIRQRFRKRDRNPALWVALALSTLLHLSMVTLFSIVIYFPRNDIEYYEFRIVESRPLTAAAPRTTASTGEQLRTPDIEGALARNDAPAEERNLGGFLPEIQLPTLEFAELERLRVRQESLRAPSYYDRIFTEEQPRDLWGRLGEGVEQLRRSIEGIAPGDRRPREAAAGAPAPGLRPAEGYAGAIEWDRPPQDRKLLFAPPIEALWNIDRDALRWPIEMVLTVNSTGRVVNVWTPMTGQGELARQVQRAVLKYRFEPLDMDKAAEQLATLRIWPGRDRP